MKYATFVAVIVNVLVTLYVAYGLFWAPIEDPLPVESVNDCANGYCG